MTMDQNTQFSHPSEYLSEGFFGPDGHMLAGINGVQSLGMAYKLLEAGVTAGEVSAIREGLADIFETECPSDGTAAALPASTIASVRDAGRELGAKGAPLDELLDAAVKVLPGWGAFALLIKHLERIHQQMTLVATFRTKEPAHA
jgi:hypothetical protein